MSSPDSPAVEPGGTVSSGVGDDGRPRALWNQPQIGRHGYLTPQTEWGDVERGNPLPYTLPPEVRRKVGLERETWQLEVVADPESNAKVDAPLSKDLGTALNFERLLELGREHGVRYLKGVTCNNLGEPLGMGLWEGVPLRVVIWMSRPVANVRRVLYQELLAKSDTLLLLAYVDDATVGYGLAHVLPVDETWVADTWKTSSRIGEIESLSVLPEYRGSGLGSELLNRLEQHLYGIGVKDLMLGALPGNTDAIRLYERRGYQPTWLYLSRFEGR